MGHRIEIKVISGPDAGKRFAFENGPIRVGRGTWAHVALDGDERVSRKHLIIRTRGSRRFEVVDTSTGGTYADKKRIRKTVLPSGTVLKLGNTTLLVQYVASRTTSKEGGDSQAVSRVSRVLMIVGSLMLLLVIIAFGLRLHRTPSTNEQDMEVDPVQEIQEGRFENAIGVLKTRINHLDGGTQDDTELYMFVVKLRDRREIAERFEAAFRLDAARDVWLMLKLSLSDDWLELQNWIQTNQIDRIERRMADVEYSP